jgi:hypothetical protein
MIEKDKNIDSLKELELEILNNQRSERKRLIKEQQDAIQNTEDVRIKDKRINQSIKETEQGQAYKEELEAFQGAIIDLIGDLNDILLLAYKGRIGRNLIPSFNSLYLKVASYRKDYSNKLIIVKPEDRQSLYSMNKRLEANIKTVLIPILSKDKNKQERLKSKL